jgi:hypothetical protein
LLSIQEQLPLTASVPSRSAELASLTEANRSRHTTDRFSTMQLPLCDSRLTPDPCIQAQIIVPPVAASTCKDIDPLYLFVCQIEWEKHEEPSAGWELISAADSSNSNTRAHARALLSSSRHLSGIGVISSDFANHRKRPEELEAEMKGPYDLEIVDNCTECTNATTNHFCRFSDSVRETLSDFSHKSTLPAGATLFVEGQTPRGVFIVCAGKVNLSTTSREGKTLILKTAEAGAWSECDGIRARI